jgi:outer membrane murein-binding lipoprotein Lpp
MRWTTTPLAAAVLAAIVLSGCATGYTLDNAVQTYSHLSAPPSQPAYRFERLPSQQASDPVQSALEAMADPALHKAGLRRDDSAPRYAVQVTAREQLALSPFADPWEYGGWGSGWNAGFARRGVGLGLHGPLFPRLEQQWFHREVSVIVRDLGSQQVVYETRASNDGPWGDSKTVLPVMFEAAMQGFPNPPAGARRVDIRIGS